VKCDTKAGGRGSRRGPQWPRVLPIQGEEERKKRSVFYFGLAGNRGVIWCATFFRKLGRGQAGLPGGRTSRKRKGKKRVKEGVARGGSLAGRGGTRKKKKKNPPKRKK